MNASARLCIIGLFVSLFFTSLVLAADAIRTSLPTTRPTGEPIAQLAPGKAKGSFRLAFHGRAQLGKPGHCALVVSIQDGLFREAGRMKLDDAKDFVFEADLPPGSYYLTVSPAVEKDSNYWPSNRQQLHIDKQGHLYQMRDGWSTPGPFVLDSRMKGLSPADGGIAAVEKPVLKWPAVAGATHYQGAYYGDDQQKWFNVDETQFVVASGIPAGGGCFWQISALDSGGKVLARGEGRFFGHGTDKEMIAKMQQAAGTCGVPLPAGSSYLGIQPLPTQVPKDPKTPTDFDSAGGVVQSEASGFLPGILVTVVEQGSPALDAGLIPDDVIVAIDGQRVPTMGNMGDWNGFTALIAKMEPGRKIALTVRRFPRELTLHAITAPIPGATTQPAQATATAPKEQPVTVKPASPAADGQPAVLTLGPAIKWSDVDSGSPVEKPFTAKAHSQIPPLTTKEGLASDFVTSIAALPNGGIAFGSQEGLSIWDGAKIRTYTGTSFTAQSRAVVRGNSGLPSSWINDLLCDSKGRLWVATNYGVCRIDMKNGGKWRLLANPDRGPTSHVMMDSTCDVQRIFEASDGTIVLGARNATIMLIDPKTDVPRLINHDDDMNHWITGIAEDAKHRLWFSVTGVGVLRYDGKGIEPVQGPWIKGTASLGLAIDGKGTVWVINGFEGLGALRSDGTTELFGTNVLPCDYLEHLMIDRAGRLLAIGNEGVSVYAADDTHQGDKAWKYAEIGDAHFISSMLNASDKNWWIIGNGASRQTELKLTSVNPRVQAIDRLKRAVEKSYPKVAADSRSAVAAKGIVVGVADKRVLRYDGKTWEDLSEKLGRIDLYQLFADSKGTIWIATSGAGLIGLDPDGNIRRYNNQPGHAMSSIYSVAETPDGTLYAGTQHGVYRLRGKTWGHVESDLFQVGQVLVDRRGRVWMLEITYSKLYVYDGKVFREVKEQTAISDESLILGTLRLDDAGNVLIDVEPRLADKLPQRTFKWDATVEGKIGTPTEVK